jgi:hypothetical protein
MLNRNATPTQQPLPIGSARRISMNPQHTASIAAAPMARRARAAVRIHGRDLALHCHESSPRGVNSRAEAFLSR